MPQSRKLAVTSRMLEEGAKGFEGGMNARKYISITKTSKATATRDIQHLLEMGAFILAGKAGDEAPLPGKYLEKYLFSSKTPDQKIKAN